MGAPRVPKGALPPPSLGALQGGPQGQIAVVVPLQRRIAILCVGRGGLVNPVGLELPAHTARPPPAAARRAAL